MSAPGSLKRNIGWTLAGNASYSLAQWGVVIALAQVTTKEAVGVLAYAMAVVGPVSALASLQLRVFMVTTAGRRFEFADFLSLRVGLLLAAYAGLAIYCLAAGVEAQTGWTVAGVAAWRGFDAVAEIHYGRWQSMERMSDVSRALVLNGVLTIAGVALAVFLWRSPVAAALGSAAASLVTAADLTRRHRAQHRGETMRPADLRRVREIAVLSAPLGIVMTLVSLQGNIPRYVIGSALGPAALGVFAAVSQLPSAGANIVTAVATAASPRLVRHHSEGDRAGFWRLMAALVALGLGLGVAGAGLALAAGRPILSVVYGAEYAEYRGLLVALSLASGLSFAGSFLGYGMTMAGEARTQVTLFVAAIAATAASSLWCVPRWGLIGATVALAAGTCIQIGGSVLVLRRATAATASVRGATM